MNYKEVVEVKITGETTNNLNQRKELWKEIVNAYNEGGEDSVKEVLSQQVDEITEEFKTLLARLREKL